LANHLISDSRPLSDEQVKSLSELDQKAEDDWAALRSLYDADTLFLERLVDEFDIKQKYMSDLFELLTTDQRNSVRGPFVYGVETGLYAMQQRVLNPYKRVLIAPDMSKLESLCIKTIADATGVDENSINEFNYLVTDWIRELPSYIYADSKEAAQFYSVEEATVLGKSLVTVLKKLRDSLELTPEQRSSFNNYNRFLIPKILPQQE